MILSIAAAVLMCAFGVICICYLVMTDKEAKKYKKQMGTVGDNVQALNESLAKQLKEIEEKLARRIIDEVSRTVTSQVTSEVTKEISRILSSGEITVGTSNGNSIADQAALAEETADELEIEELDGDFAIDLDDILADDMEPAHVAGANATKPVVSEDALRRAMEAVPVQLRRGTLDQGVPTEMNGMLYENKTRDNSGGYSKPIGYNTPKPMAYNSPTEYGNRMEYDRGRSGKKYTIDELDQLIN
ncbi:MAG: hypothetical protein Q4B78_02345 [Bacillota bacterium]|nr:hypothetical protein [Bacillota bacterium]